MKKVLSVLFVLLTVCALVLSACEIPQASTSSEATTPNTPDLDISEGLEYQLSDDGQSYILIGIGSFAGDTLVIPSTHEGKPVSAIGEAAFKFNNDIVEAHIPDSIKEMGDDVFGWCSSLKKISIGAGITHIPQFAFSYTAVEEMIIPDTVTSISYTAFWDCTSLTSIKLGMGITKLGALNDTYLGEITFDGYSDFSGCTSLTSIIVSEDHPTFKTIDGSLYSKDGSAIVKYALGNSDTSFVIPEHVSVIEEGAFYDADNLTAVVVPNTVSEVLNWAFEECSSVRTVSIGKDVAKIERWAFANCASLISIEVEEENENYKSLDGNLYSKDGTVFMQYALGSGATEFTVPQGVKIIETASFSNAQNLVKLTLPEGVERIKNDAVANCNSLAEIYLPSSLTDIEMGAFQSCKGLLTIVYNGTVEEWSNINFGFGWDSLTSDYSIRCTDGMINSLD